MMRRFSPVIVTIVVAAIAFAGGAWWARRDGGPATQTQAAVTYTCPMHPQYRVDRPGDCPMCGMRLEPAGAGGAAAPAGDRAGALGPGELYVSPERQQAIGVRLGTVERVSGARFLRTTGRVAPDENATYPIVAGVSGWIRNVRSATTGSHVRKDEILASFYAPEFVIAQQSYYTGLETVDRVSSQQLPVQSYNQGRVVEGLQRFADTLRNLGVSETQLASMAQTRTLVQDIHVMSPVDGFVLQRNVSLGLRFDRGFEFYRIADLRRVWILADVYEHQLPFIRPGTHARATTGEEGQAFAATVSSAEPIFDEATLTLKVRLESSNPRSALKPGMFVDVEFPVELPASLVVPAEAIVDTGLRKTVFVDRANGYFEPRQVETGWRMGDQVEVLKGLMAGERIVISGTFLIDSESRMKAAARGVFGTAARDPVCGMEVDEKRARAAGRHVEHQGRTYFFCADECKRAFEKDPARYAEPAPPAAAAAPPAGAASQADEQKDLVCGMDVSVKEAVAAGRTSQHQGRTYYFCSDGCKKAFDEAPEKFVTK
jgi:RND family efflux transporter MFP subunit